MGNFEAIVTFGDSDFSQLCLSLPSPFLSHPKISAALFVSCI